MRGLDGGQFLLALRSTLAQQCLVFGLLLFLTVHTPALEASEVAATLKTHGSDQTLDFRRLGVRLGILFLCALDLAPDDIFPDIVLLGQVEESPDLGSTLRAEPLGKDIIREAGECVLTLLDDDEGEDGNVRADDASPDGLALALAGAAGTVARVAIGKKKLDTAGKEDTLLHGEALLVVTASDAKDVAFIFITERVSVDLLGDLPVVEDADSALVVEFDGLLFPSGGVGDVQLHA